MPAKLKVAVLGATGYSGIELTRILSRHPRVESPLLLRRNKEGCAADSLPQIAGNGYSPIETFSWDKFQDQATELLFLATPHEVSRELVPEAISRGLRVVDLSGAWRLKREE